jgi:threonine synthase
VGVGLGIEKMGVKSQMIAAIAPNTKIAHSIEGYYHLEEPKITKMIEKTNGKIIPVTDDDLKKATLDLANQGIIVEPASAAGIAAISYLRLRKRDTVCCTVTGSGFKYPNMMSDLL